ncbi:MAG TPA: hypothetical protein VK428_12535 [Acidimicrobiales bacterium]|nr:hypothetical protein [Acidimicrobiales bacterium]
MTGNDVRLWAHAFSPGFGTVSWTSWWADLVSLESGLDKLQGDAKFMALAEEGRSFIDGPIDDGLLQIVSGEIDPSAANEVQYVAGAQAVCAAGNIGRAMTVGIELAQKGEAITGVRTLFVRALTGTYGTVGWLTGYRDLAEFETAQDKLAVDPSFIAAVDDTKGVFVEDPVVTQQVIYRKLA